MLPPLIQAAKKAIATLTTRCAGHVFGQMFPAASGSRPEAVRSPKRITDQGSSRTTHSAVGKAPPVNGYSAKTARERRMRSDASASAASASTKTDDLVGNRKRAAA